MYANLRITIHEGETPEVVYAWEAKRREDGSLYLGLDDNGGQSSYAVEAGDRIIPAGVSVDIDPDF